MFGIAGYYTPQQEIRLPYKDREVLCIIGQVVLEASCCDSNTDWVYALVPGYILNWRDSVNEDGLPVSAVEPVRDTKEREEIRKVIQTEEPSVLIDFW
jgi:hypothetical protein